MLGQGYGHRDNVHRLGVRIIALVSEIWNFKQHWVRTTTWGYLQNATSKNWTGCVGLLQRNEANLSAAGMTYVPARHPVIDSGFCVLRYRLVRASY